MLQLMNIFVSSIYKGQGQGAPFYPVEWGYFLHLFFFILVQTNRKSFAS